MFSLMFRLCFQVRMHSVAAVSPSQNRNMTSPSCRVTVSTYPLTYPACFIVRIFILHITFDAPRMTRELHPSQLMESGEHAMVTHDIMFLPQTWEPVGRKSFQMAAMKILRHRHCEIGAAHALSHSHKASSLPYALTGLINVEIESWVARRMRGLVRHARHQRCTSCRRL